MDLLKRARALKKLGFFPDLEDEDLQNVCDDTADGDYDPDDAPATALLAAAGEVLEVPLETLEDPGDYEGILMAVEEFCDDVFAIDEVDVFVEETSNQEEDEGNGKGHDTETDYSSKVVVLRFKIDGKETETQLNYDGNFVDLNFLDLINKHLSKIGEERQLCPLVEVVDDTARYVFMRPEAVEKAELDEIITAPDFEG